MFDVGWSELVVIGVVALVVIGPKELPGVIRNVGRAVAKLRTMAGDFRGQFDEAMREAELSDVQKTFTDAKDMAGSAVKAAVNPIGAIKDEFVSSVASINESAKSLEADLKPAPVTAPLPLVEPVAEAPKPKAKPAPKPKAVKTAEAAPAKPKAPRKKATGTGEGA